MQRIVLDTNVLVSALIGKGNPKRILELILAGRVNCCLSNAVFQEYVEVLNRPKFAQYAEFQTHAENILASLSALANMVEPHIELWQKCPDEDDNKFLELALVAKAEYLKTGNLKHFPQKNYKQMIVSPSQYIQRVIAKP